MMTVRDKRDYKRQTNTDLGIGEAVALHVSTITWPSITVICSCGSMFVTGKAVELDVRTMK